MLISRVATEAGVSVSTLRYYERIGLVRPAGRTPSGYRDYDADALRRLAAIAHLKGLGLTLDEVAPDVDAWMAGECTPVRERLHARLSSRLADVRGQIDAGGDEERRLEALVARLDERPAPARCDDGCGCDLEEVSTPVSACSLGPDDLASRRDEWRVALEDALRIERADRSLRAVFVRSAGKAAHLAALCVAETECCPSFRFGLAIDDRAMTLSIAGAVSVFADLGGQAERQSA